jgi:hypothetical protein
MKCVSLNRCKLNERGLLNIGEFCLPAYRETSEQLVLERLSLSDGAQTTSGHLFGVQLDGVVIEVESLLNDRGELANATSLLAQHLLGLGGQDDDLGTGRCHADLDARVAILG